VPQRLDEGLYPVPPDCALDEKFDLGAFTGRWYITAGLNPLFDIFDCQVGGRAGPGWASPAPPEGWLPCCRSPRACWGAAAKLLPAATLAAPSRLHLAPRRRRTAHLHLHRHRHTSRLPPHTPPPQVHFFASPEEGKLVGKLNWRIPKGDDFIERGTIQSFVQDAQNRGGPPLPLPPPPPLPLLLLLPLPAC
jgi:hypothetical protein